MRRKKQSYLFYLLFIVIFLALIGFVISSDNFEKNPPKISVNDEIYWNLKSPLTINIDDDGGIKFARVLISDGQNEMALFSQSYDEILKSRQIQISVPKTIFFSSPKKEYTLSIEAVDNSKWNFFMGNESKKIAKVILDTTRPEIYILSNSYSIAKGGAAAVVFRASDNALKEVYVKTKDGQKFEPFTFIKDGFYAAIIAWRADAPDFSADIIARDFAGNEAKERIRYFHANKKYRTSYIALKDSFIDGKISDLAAQYAKDAHSMERLDKMKFVNETLRGANEQKIKTLTSNVDAKAVSNFNIQPFYPLRNGKKVADFADHRYYTYGDSKQVVTQGWHMGLDLASVAAAPIIASNSGKVVFAGENGIYGLNVIIDHGYGIYSLYAHCSNILVQVGDEVKVGDKIASTGTSGLALGDHLHFGILIQGVEVLPQEWMDKKWITDNITDVLNSGKKSISMQ